jgi:ABC-type amino acid transport substrate-binding protein
MKARKKKKTIIIFLIIILIVSAFVGTLYYITSTVNNYSYSEKKWISDNTDTTFDVYVETSLPIFSSNGKGVYYDYLNALKEDTGLSLNVVTNDSVSNKLVNKNSVLSTDLVIYKDHFVVIGSNKTSINKLTDLSYKNVGIITKDKASITYYLTEYKNINIKTYDKFDDIKTAFASGAIDYIVIPMYKYINEIVSSDFEIVYHLDGLYSYYVISPDEKNSALLNIMSKFYYRWQDKAQTRINEYFLDIYYNSKDYTEIEKESITNDDFIVGYIQNLPYEGLIHNSFTGLTDTYLSKFSDITGVTYKYVKYDDTKELNNALMSKKVDIVLNYYSLNSENYANSRTLGPTDYVVLAHVDNNLVLIHYIV